MLLEPRMSVSIKRRDVKASWDEGWVGKRVHGGNFGKDDPARPMTIHESQDDDTILFVEMDGEKFRVCRKKRAGF